MEWEAFTSAVINSAQTQGTLFHNMLSWVEDTMSQSREGAYLR